MPFRLLTLLLLASLAFADERADFLKASDELSKAYFDELAVDQRDRLFEALGRYDHPDIVKPVAEVASRFGAFLGLIEAQKAEAEKKLAPLMASTSLSDLDVGLRNSYTRKVQEAEEKERLGAASEALLVRALGACKEEKTVLAAGRELGKHPAWRVRRILAAASAQWHKGLGSEKATRTVFDTLKKFRTDEEPRVRIAVAQSLAQFKRQEALDLLEQLYSDADWRVRAAVTESLRTVGSAECVTLLVARMKLETGRLQDDIAQALSAVTGEKWQYAEEWERWWNGVGKVLTADRTAGAAARAAEQRENAKGGDRFYGIPTNSDHICYIIDRSGSMEKEVEQFKQVTITGRKEGETPVGGKTRIEVAKNELKRAIGNLASSKRFSIIFFNHGVQRWRSEPVKATPDNKKEALADIDRITAVGATYSLGALREAFSMAGAIQSAGKTKRDNASVDTIFFLSDGGPTDNRIEEAQPMDPEPILESVRQWNRDAKIVIHTIAVDTEEVGTYFLKQLAAQNGGMFVERRK